MAERKALLLRIDPELYDTLARWAADELRSVNGQIEFLLRRSVAEGGRAEKRKRSKDGGAQEGRSR